MASLVVRPARLSTSCLSYAKYIACRTATSIDNSNNNTRTNKSYRGRSLCRCFHATPRPQFIEPLLSTTQNLLHTIHSTTHLPWALSLPLAALLIRLAITLPMAIRIRRAQQIQYDLQPLLSAWAQQTRASHMATSGRLGPAAVARSTARAMVVKRREIYRRWGCQRWKLFLPLAQLPVWLLVVETIRRMSGSHKGLLGLVTDWSSSEQAQGMATASSSGLAAHGLAAEVVERTSESVANAAVMMEPSMATEGILWFTDLTAADPLLVLPFMLSASMFLNIYAKERNVTIPYLQRSKSAQRWTRALGVVALAAGPLTLQMPSAMLVYWVSSSLMGYGQFLLLDRLMPLKPPLKPCKPKPEAVL